MASPAPPISNLGVGDILAFSDTELVEYLLENRGAIGGFTLDNIAGWEELAKEERDKLAERLRAGAIGAIKASDAALSRPADLDQVTARLLNISANKSISLQDYIHDDKILANILAAGYQLLQDEHEPPRTQAEMDKKEVDQGKIYEVLCYYELVEEGGRPLYPISLIDDVVEGPEKYREMLRPWQRYPDTRDGRPNWRAVFGNQLASWRAFHGWQQDKRGIYNLDVEYAAYDESSKRGSVVYGYKDAIAKLEADPSRDRNFFIGWEKKRRREQCGLLEVDTADDDRRWEQEGHPEIGGDGGFPDYAEAVRRRLAKHGLTRPFQLERDPTRQDALATWMEYLCFEYCHYDRYKRWVEKLQPAYDEAWEKLVASGVLRPGETRESVHTDECAMQDQSEKDRAAKALAAAKSCAKEILVSARNLPTSEQRIAKLKAAHARLAKAEASFQSAKKRSDLITDFIRGHSNYQDAKKNVERYENLLSWIVDQLPLIEAELKESKPPGAEC